MSAGIVLTVSATEFSALTPRCDQKGLRLCLVAAKATLKLALLIASAVMKLPKHTARYLRLERGRVWQLSLTCSVNTRMSVSDAGMASAPWRFAGR